MQSTNSKYGTPYLATRHLLSFPTWKWNQCLSILYRTTRWAPETDPQWRRCLLDGQRDKTTGTRWVLCTIWLCCSWNKLLVRLARGELAPRLSLVSPRIFFSILPLMEFWFLAAVAYGLLSWRHLFSSDIVDLMAQILFKPNWAGWQHHWIQWWTAFNWKLSVYYCPFALLTHYFPIWYCKAALTQYVLLKALYK